MDYKYSQVDNNNISWFKNDSSVCSLFKIKLIGRIRGLNNFEIYFNYPISVIAGKNGSGKSTLLALAACAYHNKPSAIKLQNRKDNYYTFSDFFIQSKDEIQLGGIEIMYLFLFDNWKITSTNTNKVGPGMQIRYKRKGGKWNRYKSRVNRNVVYFGIDRVVPHSEKSVSRSYRNAFKDELELGTEQEVKRIVGRILNKDYKQFWFKKYLKYRLPVVQLETSIYSGFNMGAGENALFEIFSTIYNFPKGTLYLMDEIELGLHEEAQTKFIEELKNICYERHIQVICTTHSCNILRNIPPEGRFYIESIGNDTIIKPEISCNYALGLMSGRNSDELNIYVEDDKAKKLLEISLTNDVRKRININSIGSSTAVIKQLSAHKKIPQNIDCLAILDGDKKNDYNNLYRLFKNSLESFSNEDEISKWYNDRIDFLPGKTHPEKWLIDIANLKYLDDLAIEFSLNIDELRDYFIEAINSGTHNEFYKLSRKLNLDENYIFQTVARIIIRKEPQIFNEILDRIKKLIK